MIIEKYDLSGQQRKLLDLIEIKVYDIAQNIQILTKRLTTNQIKDAMGQHFSIFLQLRYIFQKFDLIPIFQIFKKMMTSSVLVTQILIQRIDNPSHQSTPLQSKADRQKQTMQINIQQQIKPLVISKLGGISLYNESYKRSLDYFQVDNIITPQVYTGKCPVRMSKKYKQKILNTCKMQQQVQQKDNFLEEVTNYISQYKQSSKMKGYVSYEKQLEQIIQFFKLSQKQAMNFLNKSPNNVEYTQDYLNRLNDLQSDIKIKQVKQKESLEEKIKYFIQKLKFKICQAEKKYEEKYQKLIQFQKNLKKQTNSQSTQTNDLTDKKIKQLQNKCHEQQQKYNILISLRKQQFNSEDKMYQLSHQLNIKQHQNKKLKNLLSQMQDNIDYFKKIIRDNKQKINISEGQFLKRTKIIKQLKSKKQIDISQTEQNQQQLEKKLFQKLKDKNKQRGSSMIRSSSGSFKRKQEILTNIQQQQINDNVDDIQQYRQIQQKKNNFEKIVRDNDKKITFKNQRKQSKKQSIQNNQEKTGVQLRRTNNKKTTIFDNKKDPNKKPNNNLMRINPNNEGGLLFAQKNDNNSKSNNQQKQMKQIQIIERSSSHNKQLKQSYFQPQFKQQQKKQDQFLIGKQIKQVNNNIDVKNITATNKDKDKNQNQNQNQQIQKENVKKVLNFNENSLKKIKKITDRQNKQKQKIKQSSFNKSNDKKKAINKNEQKITKIYKANSLSSSKLKSTNNNNKQINNHHVQNQAIQSQKQQINNQNEVQEQKQKQQIKSKQKTKTISNIKQKQQKIYFKYNIPLSKKGQKKYKDFIKKDGQSYEQKQQGSLQNSKQNSDIQQNELSQDYIENKNINKYNINQKIEQHETQVLLQINKQFNIKIFYNNQNPRYQYEDDKQKICLKSPDLKAFYIQNKHQKKYINRSSTFKQSTNKNLIKSHNSQKYMYLRMKKSTQDQIQQKNRIGVQNYFKQHQKFKQDFKQIQINYQQLKIDTKTIKNQAKNHTKNYSSSKIKNKNQKQNIIDQFMKTQPKMSNSNSHYKKNQILSSKHLQKPVNIKYNDLLLLLQNSARSENNVYNNQLKIIIHKNNNKGNLLSHQKHTNLNRKNKQKIDEDLCFSSQNKNVISFIFKQIEKQSLDIQQFKQILTKLSEDQSKNYQTKPRVSQQLNLKSALLFDSQRTSCIEPKKSQKTFNIRNISQQKHNQKFFGLTIIPIDEIRLIHQKRGKCKNEDDKICQHLQKYFNLIKKLKQGEGRQSLKLHIERIGQENSNQRISKNQVYQYINQHMHSEDNEQSQKRALPIIYATSQGYYRPKKQNQNSKK